MKVRVAVHGRFHAFELARGLHARGVLECLQTTYPRFAARRIVGQDMPLISIPHLEIKRRLASRLGFNTTMDVSIAKGFAQAVARSLGQSNADILTGWSSATLEAIPTAHEKDMKVVIERGSTHIAHQTEVLESTHRGLGLETRITPAEIITRELAEYDAADAIVVPSEIARSTFISRGVPARKVFVNHLGVDTSQFSPPTTPRDNKVPVILFVGMLSARKGTATLLEAFAQLKQRAELLCVGPVDPHFQKVLNRLPSSNVTLLGSVSRADVHDAYRNADIFCLPSVEEGFGMVVLEAMASGLPVVLSDQVGAADSIQPGIDGLVVPVGDVTALSNALSSLVSDENSRRRMGAAAAKKARASQSWDGYIERTLEIYNSILVS
ncbi:MAG: glycosyltransferase family 4 protein [Rhodospirillales bacterium]|nr:glycosyltransferase family 4 protein [Rhodospirillales bacterium]